MTQKKLVQMVLLGIGIALAGAGAPAAYAGDYGCEPPGEQAKGNNGWGQEKNKGTTDGTNNGSDDGATAESKSVSTAR
ncbi:hypothetical protein CU102_03210 [Phyllobacterium brassicacearum]|uniref:Uncharacterized protein n=1 Tax=Phyllobacterium brassicacearum TaxID=314235 RepID=A0A2P7BUL0_9HYPH|nr:hypothetical protein [Phyllobacterium brassicacearum]PSH70121.1 hypothetical protein CU102_03210 [Phyllobacterium brassicacearum]TDQ34009.1 hypothetical protein DEV91_104212 [Phyllobacterium brassicacearum]